MSKKWRWALPIVAMFAITGGLWLQFTPTAQAAINPTINFQGKLTNPDGTNVTNGNYSIRFRIYTDPTADTADPCANSCLWEETQATVAVSDGIFRVALGSVTGLPGSVNFNLSALYLSMKVGVDSEMSPRIQLTASPYAFNSDMLDGLDSTNLVQLGQGTQTDASTTDASLSINKTGGTALIFDVQRGGTAIFQLANNGSALFRNQADSATGFQIQSQASNPLLTVDTSAANVYIGNPTADAVAAQLVVDTKNTAGDPTGVNGGIYYNSNIGTLRCYEGGAWKDCLGGANSTASFVSGLANAVVNSAGQVAETLIFPTATSVSTAAGVTGFTAPSGGSFRTCMMKNQNAAPVTAGTISVRWRVNGVSSGGAACTMNNAANNRQAATALDPGVVTFSAGDTIGIAIDVSAGQTPNSQDLTIYWTIEYNSTATNVPGATLQSAYDNNPMLSTTDDHDFVINATDTATDANVIVNLQCTTACGGNGRFAVQDGGVDVFAVGPTGGITIGNTSTSLTIENGTGVAALFNGATAHTVQFATGAAAQSVSIGSTNTTSSLTLNAGTGNATINATGGNVNIQTTTSGAINLIPGGASNIVLGTSDATGTQLVLDTKTSAGDPTGVNGGQYYNSNSGKFRCFEASAWKNCITAEPDTATFEDITAAAWAGDNQTTQLFNDATKPFIVTDFANSAVLITVHIAGVSNTANDAFLAARIVFTTNGVDPSCVTSTQVGRSMIAGFTTAATHPYQLTGTFVHTPGVAGTIKYTVCSSDDASGTTLTDTADHINVSIVELGP